MKRAEVTDEEDARLTGQVIVQASAIGCLMWLVILAVLAAILKWVLS